LLLETGAKSVEELAKATGIPKENVQAYLDVMAQKGLVKKQKNKYANT
jgi:DNA-binding IclR family transcriptional regulator